MHKFWSLTHTQNISVTLNQYQSLNLFQVLGRIVNMNAVIDDQKRDEMKEKFESLLSKRNVKENSSLLNREKLLSLIADVKRCKKTSKKVPRDYWLLKHYDVLEVRGVEKLIVPVTKTKPNVLFYCSSDCLFDILYETHLSIGHGGRDRMVKELNRYYKNITQNDIKLFLNFCEPCQQKRKSNKKDVKQSLIFPQINSRCQVDIIDFQSQPDENYKFIFVYQDHPTKFVILRPLATKTAEEISKQLLDVFLMFGVPCVLQSNNGRQFCIQIIENLKLYWPELKVVHGDPRKGSTERANQDIKNMLLKWMQDNQSTSWSKSLKFIQFMKNSTFNSSIKKSPYKAMFGCEARLGLSTTSIPKELLDSLQNEEDLQHILTSMSIVYQDDDRIGVEKTNSNKSIDKLCRVCSRQCSNKLLCIKCNEPVDIFCVENYVLEDKIVKVCKVCFKDENVKKENEHSDKYLETQAKKSKLQTDKNNSENYPNT